ERGAVRAAEDVHGDDRDVAGDPDDCEPRAWPAQDERGEQALADAGGQEEGAVGPPLAQVRGDVGKVDPCGAERERGGDGDGRARRCGGFARAWRRSRKRELHGSTAVAGRTGAWPDRW